MQEIALRTFLAIFHHSGMASLCLYNFHLRKPRRKQWRTFWQFASNNDVDRERLYAEFFSYWREWSG